jgi:predicted transcriptional regulator
MFLREDMCEEITFYFLRMIQSPIIKYKRKIFMNVSTDYKSKLETYYDILKIINDGNEKHQEILSITKVNRASLDNFLDALVERKILLKKGKEEDIRYTITAKGQKFVLNISKALKLINLN